MEVVDRDNDGQKEGVEIFYILKKGKEIISLDPHIVLNLEAYLYEDKKEVLISYWQIDSAEKFFSTSFIYLPFQPGFAYNIYRDKIIPALLKIKIIFVDEREIQAQIKDRLSFLVY